MFVWKKEFELGIPSIDEQHKELLRIGNKISELVNDVAYDENNKDEAYGIINELKEYTKYHFRTEEDLFLKYKYTGIVEHIKEHRSFVDFLDKFDYENTVNSRDLLLELLNKVVEWVFHHIITTDFLYKDFLIKMGQK